MTVAVVLLLILAGAYVAFATGRRRIAVRPVALVRVNHRGIEVPAVLGDGLTLAGILGCALGALLATFDLVDAADPEHLAATASVLVVLYVAGSLDDHRGDEKDRGFKGHLRALRSGRVTGGMVKLLSGGVAGLAAGAIVTGGDAWAAIRCGLLVALTANLINLLDRAPGRALKASLILALPGLVYGGSAFVIATSATFGGAAGVTGDDLGEKGMLGDAGANPLGGVIGLGLFLATPQVLGWVVVALLAGLNLASERWSFGKVIEGVPALRWADRLGRETSSRRYPDA